MHKTRIDIPEKTRRKVVGVLAERLAEAIDLSLQLKQAHWNVKGPRFIALHEFFDKVASQVNSHVDELAERITTLGAVAEGTVAAVAARSSLKAYPLTINTGSDHLEAVAGALAHYAHQLREGIDATDKLGDKVTADLLTGLAGQADKQLWFVEAHLQAKD